MSNSKFSVCMSVYRNDNPDDFTEAVMSIYNQTCRPDEIVLVVDGPVSAELRQAIDATKDKLGIMKLVPFRENRGHAAARQAGLEHARNELVAVMDSDDIAEPCRFEIQLALMDEHPEVTVVGSLIHEFIGNPSNVVGTRTVPESDEEIKKYMKSRCPMNLQTVMYRKTKVMEVGGFIDWYCEEDYYLWLRLAMAGHKFYNCQTSLVNVRVGKEMYKRRGGLKYFKSEARLQRYMLDNQIINRGGYLANIAKRLIVQVLLPNSIRGWVFRKFARD